MLMNYFIGRVEPAGSSDLRCVPPRRILAQMQRVRGLLEPHGRPRRRPHQVRPRVRVSETGVRVGGSTAARLVVFCRRQDPLPTLW